MKDKLLIFNDKKIDLYTTIYILLLVMIISGVFGFIYETIFYRIDLGYFTKRGSSFGPWIPIYAFGGFILTIVNYRYKKNPFLIFLISSIITGILEYSTGYVFDKLFHTRLWDYNVEILNFGNINGYICARSILFFGVASLFLIYVIIPFLLKLATSISKNNLRNMAVSLSTVFLIDIVTYGIIK